MPTLNACPYCRNTCAKCHGSTSSHDSAHPVWVCSDCYRKYERKCCVCGGKKSGPGSVGSTGPGKVCKKCYKTNTCTFCGVRL